SSPGSPVKRAPSPSSCSMTRMTTGAPFPFIQHRRVIGLSFAAMRSARRGMGSDVAGSRPYRSGDDVKKIDWAGSARLSIARGSDEFIVREHYADEAPRVVVFCDRRAGMAATPQPPPWPHTT